MRIKRSNWRFLENLNDVEIEHEDGNVKFSEYRGRNTALAQGLKVSCVFNGIEEVLCQKIRDYSGKNKIIVGCVAWLTNNSILEAFGNANAAQLIVQKEDFLRPDSNHDDEFKDKLRRKYEKIGSPYIRVCVKTESGLLSSLSYMSSPDVGGIRCVGNHNRDKVPAFPRMHHKFIVLCSIKSKIGDFKAETFTVKPEIVITGSFNYTENSTNSLENIIIIERGSSETNPIADEYLREWESVYAISENLDWETDWISPQYRIGS